MPDKTAKEAFLYRVDRLGTGEKAALKRAAGKALDKADVAAQVAFYKCLTEDVQEKNENKWFFVACLRALWKTTTHSRVPIEKLLRQLYERGAMSEHMLRQITCLIGNRWDDRGHQAALLTHILKAVKQKSENSDFDFAALLDDVEHWDDSGKRVKLRWTRVLHGAMLENSH